MRHFRAVFRTWELEESRMAAVQVVQGRLVVIEPVRGTCKRRQRLNRTTRRHSRRLLDVRYGTVAHQNFDNRM